MITISCFSYKGGAGRSTLAMNIVPYLASVLNATEERPLILVDMDIDSCGITYFLNIDNFKESFKNEHAVQDLFGSTGSPHRDNNAPNAKEHDFFSKLPGVGRYFNKPNRSILCIPALPGGKLGGTNNYDGSNSSLLEDFVDECNRHNLAGVLLDSSVGDQLTAKWSNNIADIILCCLRPTEQFREGTSRFFDNFDENICQGKTIVVIPNVVPTEPLTIQEENGKMEYPEHAKEKILEAFQDNIKRGLNIYDMSMLENGLFGVPKIDRFMWRESVLYAASDLTESERKALASYEAIANIIGRIKDEQSDF